jgi:hypothetical protein
VTATFYDRKAERVAAAGLAARDQAAAEQQRLHNQSLALGLAQQRADLIEQARDRQDQRDRERREERRDQRAKTWAAIKAGTPARLVSALWAAVIVAPLTLAWNAQLQFAENTLHISTHFSWLFPLAVEAGAWVCAFEAYLRSRRGDSAGSLPRWMWVLAGVAATINAVHGAVDDGLGAGLALGALSVLGVLLHHIRQHLDAATAAGIDSATLKRRMARRVAHPLLSIRAWSIRARAEMTVDQAWTAAHIDVYGVLPGASRRDRELGLKITQRARTEDLKAAEAGQLMIIGGVILRAFPETVGNLPTPIVQGVCDVDDLSEDRGRVLAAIDAGTLPAGPSANAIYRYLGGRGAKDKAARLRSQVADYVPELRPVPDDTERG